tara:strand:- start:694 stop:885 length:192 start_codon:yes stop_codon:yes gene_type:complete
MEVKMSNSNYFDKFVKDLEKRQEKKKDHRTISESEKEYQEKRRMRVRRFQELWQNRTVFRGKK